MTLPFQDLRDALGAKIAALDHPRAEAYAAFIRGSDPSVPAPCWGAIGKRFDADFPRDEERIPVLRVVLEHGDARALLLFLARNLDRVGVRRRVAARLDVLPPLLQRAMVAVLPTEEVPAELRAKLHPAARALLDADEAVRVREAEQFQVRAKKLVAFEYFVESPSEPPVEPE